MTGGDPVVIAHGAIWKRRLIALVRLFLADDFVLYTRRNSMPTNLNWQAAARGDVWIAAAAHAANRAEEIKLLAHAMSLRPDDISDERNGDDQTT